MSNFEEVTHRRLTSIEWRALQAALPCTRGGLPVVPGILDKLSAMNLTYYDLFVLQGSYTQQIGATYYVLLGFGDNDDIVPEPPEPFIFGIYTDDHPTEPLPDFEELYRHGIGILQGQIRHDAITDSILISVCSAMITSVIWPGLVTLGAAVFAGIVGGVTVYWLKSRTIPRLDPTSVTTIRRV